jgi:hypothetical protein
MAGIEIEDNAFIGKLQSRNVLDVRPLDDKAESEEGGGDKRAAADKAESRAKPVKKDK